MNGLWFPILTLLLFIFSASCAGKVSKKNGEESVGIKIMIGDNDTYEFEHVAGAIELLPMVLEQREGRGQLLQAAAYKLEISSGTWFNMQICSHLPFGTF